MLNVFGVKKWDYIKYLLFLIGYRTGQTDRFFLNYYLGSKGVARHGFF